MYIFKNLKQTNSFNNRYNNIDSPYYNFINNVKFSMRRGVNIDPMGRKYFFRDDNDEKDNNNETKQISQSQSFIPFNNKNKINNIERPEQLNKKKMLEKLKNSNEEISKTILKEQQKINTMELNEIFRVQNHNQVMGSLMKENMKKKLLLKKLKLELKNKNEKLKNYSKENNHIILSKNLYKKNKLNELKKINKKLSESIELIKINHSVSMNMLKESLYKTIEENEKIKNEKNQLRFEIGILRDEIYKIKEKKNDISLPIIKIQKPINQNLIYDNNNQSNYYDYDDNWLKKIIQRDNYLLKKYDTEYEYENF